MGRLEEARRVLRLIKDPEREPRPGEYEVICPACEKRLGTPDTSGNLGVNVDKGVFHCWRCGWSGTLKGLGGALQESDDCDAWTVSLPRATAQKARWAPLDYPEDVLPNGFVEVDPENPPSFYGARVLAYLRGRGLDDKAIGRLHPGYTLDYPENGQQDCRGRVVLPIILGGRVVSYVARTLGTQTPKTLNPKLPPGLGKPLWGLDEIPLYSWLVVVEGIFDALATPRGVAVLGDRLTKEQRYRLLAKCPKLIVFLYDGDAPGKRAAYRDARAMREISSAEIKIAALPPGKDPGDYQGDLLMLRGSIELAKRWTLLTGLAALMGTVR